MWFCECLKEKCRERCAGFCIRKFNNRHPVCGKRFFVIPKGSISLDDTSIMEWDSEEASLAVRFLSARPGFACFLREQWLLGWVVKRAEM